MANRRQRFGRDAVEFRGGISTAVPFRDELAAAQHRVEQLEREVDEQRAENEALRSNSAPADSPAAMWGSALVGLTGASAAIAGAVANVLPLVVAGAAAVSLAIALIAVTRLLIIVPPNEVLVLSGRRRQAPDGRSVGWRFVRGGRVVRVPFLESVDRLDLTNMIFEISVRGAQTRDKIDVSVDFVANAHIAGSEPQLTNAAERLLGKSRDDVKKMVEGTLEGGLRGLIRVLSVDALREDRLLFAQQAIEHLEPDLHRLGISLDTLQVMRVEVRDPG